MHCRIIEVRKNCPFSAEEIKNGTMNETVIQQMHENEWFDYIVPAEVSREEDIDWFLHRLNGVFKYDNSNGDRLILSQKAFDANLENYVQEVKDFVNIITPDNFSQMRYKLLRYGTMCPRSFDFFIYSEEIGDTIPVQEWLLTASRYQHKGVKPAYYIGKIWDYHL